MAITYYTPETKRNLFYDMENILREYKTELLCICTLLIVIYIIVDIFKIYIVRTYGSNAKLRYYKPNSPEMYSIVRDFNDTNKKK
ncbi:MAG: hypothetical protein EOP34_04665 [Rickettsiales bacterium]|nr:MAG: hypothetical protein EOP34_04665 [Rickettsiales bacterium]